MKNRQDSLERAHTPGPWKIGTTLSNEGARAVMASEDRVAVVDAQQDGRAHHMTDCPEREANCSLIAAAPDLLESLDELLALCNRQTDFNDDGDGGTLGRAKAAIAKAGGSK